MIILRYGKVRTCKSMDCDARSYQTDKVMPIVPQSEIQVKFLEEMFKESDEKRGEILAKFSVDSRPSISREIGHQKFHTNSSTHQDVKFHTAEPKFFHSTLRAGGPKIKKVMFSCIRFSQAKVDEAIARLGSNLLASTFVSSQ